MALTLDRSVLEKIEALQNIMLASVTGGARDEAEYRPIREELLRLPGLKDALPRFVRTCGDLSQLWHFIKTQEKLGSYASRREYIWKAFRPLLAGVDDDAGIEREVFFVRDRTTMPTSTYGAFCKPRKVICLLSTRTWTVRSIRLWVLLLLRR